MYTFKEICPQMQNVVKRCETHCVVSAEDNCELSAKIKSEAEEITSVFGLVKQRECKARKTRSFKPAFCCFLNLSDE